MDTALSPDVGQLGNQCALRFAADESSRAASARAFAVGALVVAYGAPALAALAAACIGRRGSSSSSCAGRLLLTSAPAMGGGFCLLLSMVAMLAALAAGSLGAAAAFAALPLALQALLLLAGSAKAARMSVRTAVGLSMGVLLVGGGLALAALADGSHFVCFSEQTILQQMRGVGFLVAVAVTVAALALSWLVIKLSEARLLAVDAQATRTPAAASGVTTTAAATKGADLSFAPDAAVTAPHPGGQRVIAAASATAPSSQSAVASLGHAAISLIEAMKSVEPHLHSSHPLQVEDGSLATGSSAGGGTASTGTAAAVVARDAATDAVGADVEAGATEAQMRQSVSAASPLTLSAAVLAAHSRGLSDSFSVPARAAVAAAAVNLPASARQPQSAPSGSQWWLFRRQTTLQAREKPLSVPPTTQTLGPWAPGAPNSARQLPEGTPAADSAATAAASAGATTRQQHSNLVATHKPSRFSRWWWSCLGSCASTAWRGPWYLALTASAAPLYLRGAQAAADSAADAQESNIGARDAEAHDHDADAALIASEAAAGRELLRALPSDTAVRHFLALVEVALQREKEAQAAIAAPAPAEAALQAVHATSIDVGAGTGLRATAGTEAYVLTIPSPANVAGGTAAASGLHVSGLEEVAATGTSPAVSAEVAASALQQFAAAARQASTAVQALGLSDASAEAEHRALALEQAATSPALPTIPEEEAVITSSLPTARRRGESAGGRLELSAALSLRAELAATPLPPMSAPASAAATAAGAAARRRTRLPAAVSDDIVSAGVGYAGADSEYAELREVAVAVAAPGCTAEAQSLSASSSDVHYTAAAFLCAASPAEASAAAGCSPVVGHAAAVDGHAEQQQQVVVGSHSHGRASAAAVALAPESPHQHHHSRVATIAAASVAAVKGGVSRALYRLRLEAAQREAQKLLAAAAMDEPPAAYANSGYARAHPLAYSGAAATAGVLTLLSCKLVAEEVKTALYATNSAHAGSSLNSSESGVQGAVRLVGGPLLWCAAAACLLFFWLHQRALANAHRLFDPLYVLPLYLALLLAGCVATGSLLTGEFAAVTPAQAGMLTAAEAALVLGALLLVDNASAAVEEEREQQLARHTAELQLQQQERQERQVLPLPTGLVSSGKQADDDYAAQTTELSLQTHERSVATNARGAAAVTVAGVDSQTALQRSHTKSSKSGYDTHRPSALNLFRTATPESRFLRRYWRTSSGGFDNTSDTSSRHQSVN